MQFSPGQLVATNLRLARQLGEGGMGSVWVADHLTLRTQVAVKFISEALSRDAEALARFSREAAASARIKSPHVVQVFDHGISQGLPYMVMELLEGEDLAALLLHRRTLAPREIAAIVDQVCKALGEAHVAGIVHRDIKPANIFLMQSGGERFVKLLDFGVAKAEGLEISLKTSTGSTVGTPYYMSPEQILGNGEVDSRSDLWSLAVVAYEALTGVVPFDGETIAALGVAIYSGTFRPPSAFGRLRSPALDAWFTRAFARAPSARFASARELADTFSAATAGLEAEGTGFAAPPSPAYGGAPLQTSMIAGAVTGDPRVAPVRAWQVVAGAAAAFALGGLGLLVWSRVAAHPREIDGAPPAVASIVALPSASADPVSAGPTPPAVGAAPRGPSVDPGSEAPPMASASSAPAKPAGGTHPTVAPTVAPTSSSKSTKRRDHGF